MNTNCESCGRPLDTGGNCHNCDYQMDAVGEVATVGNRLATDREVLSAQLKSIEKLLSDLRVDQAFTHSHFSGIEEKLDKLITFLMLEPDETIEEFMATPPDNTP